MTVPADVPAEWADGAPWARRWTWARPVPLRWLLVDEFDGDLDDPVVAVAVCADVDGLFYDAPTPSVGDRADAPPVTLVGCAPLPPLRSAVDALREGRAARDRRIAVSVYAVDAAGAVVPTHTGGLFGAVTGVRASAAGHGLLDVTVDGGLAKPLPTGAREIWDRWYTGPPAERNLWRGYQPSLRDEWVSAALAHRPDLSDQPAGRTYHLDGRFVSDIEGFYCAIGEAVNGPGGYFGGNLDGLDDCLRGGWGAETPFRLVWHDAGVARRQVDGLRDVLDMLAEHGVDVHLR